MAYTPERTWTDGDTVSASDLNVYLRDNVDYVKALADGFVFSGVRLDRNSTNQSIPDSTWTAVSFTRELLDAGGWWSAGTTSTTPSGAIPAGFTTVVIDARMYAAFAANATGIRAARVLRGGSPFVTNKYSASSADTTDLSGSMLTTAVAADTFTMEVYQSSGGALNLTDVALAVVVFKPLS